MKKQKYVVDLKNRQNKLNDEDLMNLAIEIQIELAKRGISIIYNSLKEKARDNQRKSKEKILMTFNKKCIGCGSIVHNGLYCVTCINQRAVKRKNFESFIKKGILINKDAESYLSKLTRPAQTKVLNNFYKNFPDKRTMFRGDLI